MKKILLYLFTFLSCICISSCSTDLYDYDELNDRMDAFDKRLAELEDWCKETNTNINSLKALVESLLQHDVITSVTPVMNENVVQGYTITFLNADPITVYHGQDGKDGEDGKDGQDGSDGADGEDGMDGYTPLIGIKQDTDGIYYWTLDGEWMTDAQGQKFKAQGEKGEDGTDGTDGSDGEDGTNGADGKDGVSPQLKIEENYWYISYDNGNTWQQLGKAIGADGKDGADGEPGKDGKDGESYFQSIDTSNADYVLFTFSDKTTLKIPTWAAFEALQTQCNQMNTNYDALQTIVTALQDKDYVTGVAPLMQDGVEIGYTITFSKSGSVVIYHGTDGSDGTNGKDGYSPSIGVKKDTDEIYYWTLDGEWLLDDDENKIKAQGHDGEQGENGISPKLKIENGFWHVSYDNGETWTQLGNENATSGNNVFKSVTVNEGNITLVLNDGTEVVIPVYQEIGITFNQKNNVSGIAANEVIYIPYTLTNATDKTKVEVSSDGNYVAKVVLTDQTKGEIVVTAPDKYVDGHVLVHIDSGYGYTSFHTINFYKQEMIFGKGQQYQVAAEGQIIEVPVKMNFDYSVDIPSSVQSWIELADSRAVEFRDETLTFTFPANPNKASRSASVGIIPDNAREPLYYITFNQASAFFTIDKTRLAVKGEGETLTVNITSSLGLNIQDMPNWITPTLTQDGTAYTLQLTVAANDTESYRTGNIKLYEDPTNGSTLLGEIEVIQIAQTDDDKKAMVIEVSANPANGYTVTLPIALSHTWNYGQYDTDCVIDWGDGTLEHVTEEDRLPTHTYEGLIEATHYDVKISGIVRALCAVYMDDVQRNGIIAVKQWGMTGLKSMNYAFSNCTNLKSVPADNTMAFLEVKNFSYCFSGCTALISEGLSPDLFTYAIEATNFESVFQGCSALTSVLGNLFKNCSKVTSFDGAFASSGLTSIPENLFAGCPNVLSFEETFEYCKSVNKIPSSLFANNINVTSFKGTFGNTSVESIPEELFESCTEVESLGGSTYWDGTFYGCKELKHIPEGLFKNNHKVISFAGLFYGCTNLTDVPEKLFANCPDVDSFRETFFQCGLTSIPSGLFDGNRKVTNFESVFSYCGKIEGSESPYTEIDGVKYHLYERKNNTEQFITPTSFNDAFWYCSKLSDYADIPSDWK